MILTEAIIRRVGKEVKNRNYSLFESYTGECFDKTMVYDLFISHSFRDKEFIVGLRYLFENAGYRVYINWIDDSDLDRENVTFDTAIKIRNRINRSKGLAYIATRNITHSKWCPWEFGISDGIHGRACILPVMNTNFNGQEYLSLYPYLDYSKSEYGKDDFCVYDQKTRSNFVVLRRWLNGVEL